jgi:hypothetical protein
VTADKKNRDDEVESAGPSGAPTDKGEAVNRSNPPETAGGPHGLAIPLSDNEVKSVTQVQLPKWVSIRGSEEAIAEGLKGTDGKVLSSIKLLQPNRVVKVIYFPDGAAGQAFSQALNGTLYNDELSANKNASHLADGN